MKQSLQLKIGQQLTMTPQLQQAIRLLQLSTLDLQQEIQEALDSNPLLEVNEDENNPNSGDESSIDGTEGNELSEVTADATDNNSETSNDLDNDFQDDSFSEENQGANADDFTVESSDDFSSDDNWETQSSNEQIPEDLPVDTSWDDIYQPQQPTTSMAAPENDDFDYDNRHTVTESLQDHLEWQLNLTPMSNRDRVIAEAIIDAVEPSGLLGSTIDDIFLGLQPHLEELENDEIFAVLHRIQQFDPAGVAAESLQDCLLIQLRQLHNQHDCFKGACQLVKNHLELLGSRDYRTLMRRMRLKEPDLKAIIDLIQSLNPRPGDQIQTTHAEYVVPDVFVRKAEDRWLVELNPDIAPRLRINNDYASLIKRADNSADNTFLRDNLQEARWFLKSLQSRNETLLKVASCIVEHQKDFLERGEEGMKPLILADVAQVVEMHESTISRVTTQKFMHTPQGIFELKYFFSSHVSTTSGGEASSTAIRARIKKLIADEDVKKPLSDSKITKLLEEEGIKVARRTIAKYREALNIPPSNERKRLV
ncbi:MAG: RNA polymerase factor sigma-54 [Cellvibrionaceae bacterium]